VDDHRVRKRTLCCHRWAGGLNLRKSGNTSKDVAGHGRSAKRLERRSTFYAKIEEKKGAGDNASEGPPPQTRTIRGKDEKTSVMGDAERAGDVSLDAGPADSPRSRRDQTLVIRKGWRRKGAQIT